MPSRRSSCLLAAALVLLGAVIPGLLWPEALWAQAPIKKAGATETDKLVAAFKNLKVETPIGPITVRASDGQSTMGARVGTTKLDPKRGTGIMAGHEYIPGDKVLPSDEEVKKLRSGG